MMKLQPPPAVAVLRHLRSTLFPMAGACLLLGSCASTSVMQPPQGAALIEAKPDPPYREGIAGIELVSVNGRSVKGTRAVIQPGPNLIRSRFRWPHGLVQEADFRFHAKQGSVYLIQYNLHPPRTKMDETVAGNFMSSAGRSSDPYAALGLIFIAPLVATVGAGERVAQHAAESGKAVQYIDLVVVARHSSEGIVRQVRAYPDGRVDAKPWDAWAQMGPR